MPHKDQSYMLATVDPALLDRVGFPAREAGRRTRPRPRQPAAGLAVAEPRREPGGVLPRRRRLPGVPRAAGPRRRARRRSSTRAATSSVATTAIWRYTPGQRRGIGSQRRSRCMRSAPTVPPTRSSSGRMHRSATRNQSTSAAALYLAVERADVKLRYRSEPVPARVERTAGGFTLAARPARARRRPRPGRRSLRRRCDRRSGRDRRRERVGSPR